MPDSKSSPGPDDVPPFIPPLIDAINRFATTVPEYLVRIADAAADAAASKKGATSEVRRFMDLAAMMQQAVKKAEPGIVIDEPPTAISDDDLFAAAVGLHAWAEGGPCHDEEKYRAVARRLWLHGSTDGKGI